MVTVCLSGFGATLADVLDMTTFIVGDLATTYPPFQKVRTELLGGHLPTSAPVGVTALVNRADSPMRSRWSLRSAADHDVSTREPRLHPIRPRRPARWALRRAAGQRRTR